MKKRVLKSLSLKSHTKTDPRLFIVRHKTVVIISAVVLFLVVIGLYAWWSVASWAAIESGSRAIVRSVDRHFDSAMGMPAKTGEEKAKKLSALVAIRQDIQSNQGICSTPGMISWQRDVLAVFKKEEDACRADILRLNDLSTNLGEVTNYLQDNRVLAGLITAVSSGQSEFDETSWQDTADKWHTLGVKLREMKVSGKFDPILKRAITEVDHVKACWAEVAAASTAKDRDRFEKAEDELSKAYGSFKDIIQLDNSTIAPLIEHLSTSTFK